MAQSVENKVLSRIHGRGRGWAFSKVDFVAEFGEASVHRALSDLARKDKIRRVLRGVYDYPRNSQLLEQALAPDLDQVAHALARKFNWRIQPTPETALNLLGLSTQVPGRWAYFSDGPSRQYEVANQGLSFTRSALKDTGFQYRQSGLLVQAIKALGKDRVNRTIIQKIRGQLDPRTRKRVLKDTRAVTGWIYHIIKEIAGDQA